MRINERKKKLMKNTGKDKNPRRKKEKLKQDV